MITFSVYGRRRVENDTEDANLGDWKDSGSLKDIGKGIDIEGRAGLVEKGRISILDILNLKCLKLLTNKWQHCKVDVLLHSSLS